MATAAEPLLMTVEQYRQLSDREDVIQELRLGKLVNISVPKFWHTKLRTHLQQLLEPHAMSLGVLAPHFAFRALPEYELRGTDLAFISQQRWKEADDDDNLRGSPELVIEVLSPSNTWSEIREKASLCLSTGAEEFWIVDPKQRTISVLQQDGGMMVYGEGQAVPLRLFGTDELPVAAVFE